MKLQQLAVLVGLMFNSRFVVEPAQAGETPAKDENKADAVTSFALEGKRAGRKIAAALGKADATIREVLTNWGEKFAAFSTSASRNEAMTLFLEGYAQGFIPEGMRDDDPAMRSKKDYAKTMKTQARAILEAFCLSNHEGKVVPISPASEWKQKLNDKGERLWHTAEGVETTDSKLGLKGPVLDKPEKLPGDWLKGFQGGYGAWYKYANNMRRGGQGGTGASSNTSTATSNRPRSTTVAQHKEIVEERIPHMVSNQLSEVIERATGQLAQRDNSEVLLFREVAHICNVIKARAKDEKIVQIAAQMFDMAEQAVSTLQVADAQKGKFQAPQPAQAGESKPQNTGAETLRGDAAPKTGTHG